MTAVHREDHFKDTGCEFSPLCQTCPLPRCKHDMTRVEVKRLHNQKRQASIAGCYIRLREANPDLTVNKVVALAATEAGVSRRTITRALAAVGATP